MELVFNVHQGTFLNNYSLMDWKTRNQRRVEITIILKINCYLMCHLSAKNALRSLIVQKVMESLRFVRNAMRDFD